MPDRVPADGSVFPNDEPSRADKDRLDKRSNLDRSPAPISERQGIDLGGSAITGLAITND